MAWLFSVSLLSSQAALRSPRLSDKAFFLSLSPASLPPRSGSCTCCALSLRHRPGPDSHVAHALISIGQHSIATFSEHL